MVGFLLIMFMFFWSCPCILPLWREVSELIVATLDISVDFSFNCLYLAELPDGLSKGDTYLMKISWLQVKKQLLNAGSRRILLP